MRSFLLQSVVLYMVICLLNSCAIPIVFEDPQPTFKRSKSKFKKKYIGTYVDFEDSSKLVIHQNFITVDANGPEESNLDTIFYISDDHVLKFYQKQYLLNLRVADNNWHFLVMDLDKDILSMNCLELPLEEQKIEEIGEIVEIETACGDTVTILLRPTRSGFKTLLKKQNLAKLAVYQKM